MCNSIKKGEIIPFREMEREKKACHTDNIKWKGNIAGFAYEQLSPSPIEQQ